MTFNPEKREKLREALKDLDAYQPGQVIFIRHSRFCPCPVNNCHEDLRSCTTIYL